MWHNPRLLNMAAGFLVAMAGLIFAVVLARLLLHSPSFPVREISVSNALEKTSRQELERASRGRIAGNIFAVDLDELRAGMESLPWVRRVALRRVWPDRVEATVEEHVPLARWGDDALVNTHGERFAAPAGASLPASLPASLTESLPMFVGPGGTEAEVAHRYARLSAAVAPLGTRVERIVLTQRFAWQLRLANGLEIMLGRDAEAGEARLRRFVQAYGETLGRMPRRHRYVDLRYPNGFALRVAGTKG